ncbi:MAG TPA: hypothetical protein VGK19_26325 [Capsulimonadaceae bacterium]|jgi:hypothetical protein
MHEIIETAETFYMIAFVVALCYSAVFVVRLRLGQKFGMKDPASTRHFLIAVSPVVVTVILGLSAPNSRLAHRIGDGMLFYVFPTAMICFWIRQRALKRQTRRASTTVDPSPDRS